MPQFDCQVGDDGVVGTAGSAPYEAAWELTHSGTSLSDAIDQLISIYHITYDRASSLVWAEMTSPSVLFPS